MQGGAVTHSMPLEAAAMRVKAFGVFLLAFCTAVLSVCAAQNQTSPPAQPDQPAASSQSPSQPDQQDADQQNGDAAPLPTAQQEPQPAPAPSTSALPPMLTVPAGTIIAVRVSQWLSSDRNHAGDTFSAVLDQPVVVQGWVAARRGQSVIGRVDVAQKASDGNGVSKLGLEITELSLVDGEQIPVSTEMQQAPPSPAAQTSPGHNAATVTTTTVLGTIVGAAIGRGQGAAIGAGLGATAGLDGAVAVGAMGSLLEE